MPLNKLGLRKENDPRNFSMHTKLSLMIKGLVFYPNLGNTKTRETRITLDKTWPTWVDEEANHRSSYCANGQDSWCIDYHQEEKAVQLLWLLFHTISAIFCISWYDFQIWANLYLFSLPSSYSVIIILRLHDHYHEEDQRILLEIELHIGFGGRVDSSGAARESSFITALLLWTVINHWLTRRSWHVKGRKFSSCKWHAS